MPRLAPELYTSPASCHAFLRQIGRGRPRATNPWERRTERVHLHVDGAWSPRHELMLKSLAVTNDLARCEPWLWLDADAGGSEDLGKLAPFVRVMRVAASDASAFDARGVLAEHGGTWLDMHLMLLRDLGDVERLHAGGWVVDGASPLAMRAGLGEPLVLPAAFFDGPLAIPPAQAAAFAARLPDRVDLGAEPFAAIERFLDRRIEQRYRFSVRAAHASPPPAPTPGRIPALLARAGVVAGRVRDRLLSVASPPLLYDVVPTTPTTPTAPAATAQTQPKRALLLAVSSGFRHAADDPSQLEHQNRKRSRMIGELLGELGFVVDVSDGRGSRIRARHHYDLVVSDRVEARVAIPRGTRLAFIATTEHHGPHNAALVRRHGALKARRGVDLTVRRLFPPDVSRLADVDALIGIGNARMLKTWTDDPAFRGVAYPTDNPAFDEMSALAAAPKDFAEARRHFLFFASASQMMKGLDLALEVFARHPELHLYVCSAFGVEPDFCAVYRRELRDLPNVHAIGWTPASSPELAPLVARCAWTILPTATEGQAGSLVQCMAAGLVPIMTPATNLDGDGFALVIDDDSVDGVERVVLAAAAHAPEELIARRDATLAAVAARHRWDAVRRRWREILATIARR